MRDELTQPATNEVIQRFAAKKGLDIETARRILDGLRIKQIAARRDDPYRNGYEPPIWYVVKAIMRNPAVSNQEATFIRKRYGLDWEDFACRIRERLSFERPVAEVLIMGANRSGKTDFASKYAMQTARLGGKHINIGFQVLATGKQVQMPRVWNYMPVDWKKQNIAGEKAKDSEEHISYSKQNGFSQSKITFKNGSDVRFVSYKGDVDASMEGSALHLCWLDEEFPKSYLDAARFRLSSERGTLVCTFTPVSGYTPVVADYLSSLVVVRSHTAWMLPIDGGEPLPWKELGLNENEYKKLETWRNEGASGDPGIPESRPEEIIERLLDPGSPRDIDEIPDGRAFATTPRIGHCRGGEAAVIWFYGRDNPYGKPGEVITTAMHDRNATKRISCRVYGIAERIAGRLFPEFTRATNVIKEEDLPKRLVRVMVVDPAPDRNWTFSWYGYDPTTGIHYKYREWPSGYEIPGVGYPGPWAIPSDRKNGINDGDKGEAQDPFGFGFDDYKAEIARVEGWKNWLDWRESHPAAGRCKDWDAIAEWSEGDGVRERIEKRIIDSRAAAQIKTGANTNKTLFEEVESRLENLEAASGQHIDVGVNILRDLIARGKFKVVDTCVNSIFTYETYCGADGGKGACKDFADCDRYYVLSDVEAFTVSDATEIGKTPEVKTDAPARAPSRLNSICATSRGRVWW